MIDTLPKPEPEPTPPAACRGTAPPLGIWPWLAMGSCLLVLAARYLQIFWSDGDICSHFETYLIKKFQAIDGGQWMVQGPELGETGICLSGPLFHWLHLPARLFSNAAVGLYVIYGLLEAVALILFLRWTMKAGVSIVFCWAAGLLLAFYSSTKVWIPENSVMASFAAMVLFGATLRARALGRARSWLLTGLIMGITLQFHFLAVFLLPAVGLHLWGGSKGRRLVASLASFFLGVAMVIAINRPSIHLTPFDHLEGDLAAKLQVIDSDVANRLVWIFTELLDPVALIGAVLIAGLWLRRRRVDPAQRLALVWFLSYSALFALCAWQSKTPGDPLPHQGLAFPGRAIISIAALAALFSWISQRLPRLAARLISTQLLLLAAASVLLFYVLVVDAARARARAYGKETGKLVASSTPCAWPSAPGLLHKPRQIMPVMQRINQVGWFSTAQPKIQMVGTNDRLASFYYWQRTAGLSWLSTPPTDMDQKVATLVIPKLDGADLSRLRGAKDYGSFLIIPDCPVLHHAVISYDGNPSQMPPDVNLPRDLPPWRLLGVYAWLTGRPPESKGAGFAVTLSGASLPNHGSCPTKGGAEASMFMVFYLPEDAAGQPLNFKLDHPPDEFRPVKVWFLLLPEME